MAEVPAEAPSNWYFNLDPKFSAQLLDPNRFFEWDDPTVCPEVGGKQVNAIPVSGKGVYPKSILEVAARLGEV